MNTQLIQTLTQTDSDSSREGIVECAYTLLQNDEDTVPIEGILNQDVAAVSSLMNIGVYTSFSSGRRYFDSGNSGIEDCAAIPLVQKLRKPCYFCGKLLHDAKKCPKRRACYLCKERGHFAVDCPLSIKESERTCLRCGETGHEMFSCNNDYYPHDMEKIHCYVCNELGHIFCGDYIDKSVPSLCYNCGECEHIGLQYPKPHVDKSSSRPPSICYKCGDEGHVGRNCITSSEASICNEGAKDAASHLGTEPDNGADVHQNPKRASRSKTYEYGRARRRRLRGLVKCMTV